MVHSSQLLSAPLTELQLIRARETLSWDTRQGHVKDVVTLI